MIEREKVFLSISFISPDDTFIHILSNNKYLLHSILFCYFAFSIQLNIYVVSMKYVLYTIGFYLDVKFGWVRDHSSIEFCQ
jgi:hypothetical protein